MKNSNENTFRLLAAIEQVGTASDPRRALEAFERESSLLRDWRIIYADMGQRGPFRLSQHTFAGGGRATSIFRGESLWVIDIDAIKPGDIPFMVGTGSYVDSNAASFIRSLAYREDPADSLLRTGVELRNFMGSDTQLNPYLYLWEAQRQWTPKTIVACRETVAAMHAMQFGPDILNAGWGARFRSHYREEAEAFADALVDEFQITLDDGLSRGIEEQVNIVEAMLVRTKIIELSSRKSSQHKLHELVTFMHEDLSTMMVRELIVCADILCRGGQTALAKKLNAVLNCRDPFALLRNCAWDAFLPRVLDMLCNSQRGAGIDFYIGNIITFDLDVAEIIKLTQLRAIALHRSSEAVYPFFDFNLEEWLGAQLGEKRMSDLGTIFQSDSFDSRAGRRSVSKIQETLEEDRLRLKRLLSRKST